MTPEERAGLRTVAAALPPGTTLPVLKEWVLDLLAGTDSTMVERSEAGDTPDLTVAQVAKRYDRAESTVRGWCCRGILPGAYKFRGRELRVPLAALVAFEAIQRPSETPRLSAPNPTAPIDWSAWRHAS